MKIVDEVEGNVGIELSAAKIRFTLGNVIITSKVIDGTFPDYKRIIPTANDKIVTVSASELAQGIDRVSTISSERSKTVKITLRSEEHTSELQSLMRLSYAVSCLTNKHSTTTTHISP